MKIIKLLFASVAGCTFAMALPAAEDTPKGIAPSDWSSIRAAYEAGRHAISRQEDGTLAARNPGQQWRTEFDGKGFTVTPDHRQWTWGLELTAYRERSLSSATSPLTHEGGKITCQRDENLTEWFINDTRGLEQGWTIHSRSTDVSPASGNLTLALAVRGDLHAQVSTDGFSVAFQTESGTTALTYGGLKAWDADGKSLSVRFEKACPKHFRIALADETARYPITIDPIAQQAYLKASNCDADDAFGASVSISWNTVVVGAPMEFSGSASGAVYVFNRVGGAWTEQARLKAPFGDGGFGGAVSVSGDTLVVGCGGSIGGSSSATSVFVFVRQGGSWSFQAPLSPSFIAPSDQLGRSVAISGDTIVIGAPGEDSNSTMINGDRTNNTLENFGAAYVFVRTGTAWNEQSYLKASNSGREDSFGLAVSISGNTIVVGADGEDSSSTSIDGDEGNNSASGSGAAYVFIRNGTNWTKQAYLKASNCGPSDHFGRAVSVSVDTIVVGAFQEDSGAINVNGNQLDNSAIDSGAAYVFSRNGSSWTQQAYLKASNTGAYDAFGWSVSVERNAVAVGAAWFFGGEDSGAVGIAGDQLNETALDSGAAYFFSRTGAIWTEHSYVKASNTGAGDLFGQAVGISQGTAVVGAYMEDSSTTGVNGTPNEAASNSGAAYVFDLNAVIQAPEIAIEQSGVNLANGSTTDFPAVVGSTAEKNFTVANTGTVDLFLTGNPKVALTGNSDFTVVAQPTSPVTDSGGSTTFTVRFTPIGSGVRTAVLSVPNNDTDENPFVINLIGVPLTFTADGDGDGMNDASEFKMASLGFNWQVNQASLVTDYYNNANGAGLYTLAQAQALHTGAPLIARDPISGRFKLTMDWNKSTNLTDFFDFPAPLGSTTSINPAGDIDFEFSVPDNAAFFQLQVE